MHIYFIFLKEYSKNKKYTRDKNWVVSIPLTQNYIIIGHLFRTKMMKSASYLVQLCGLHMIVCQFMIKAVIYKNDSKQMRSTCFALIGSGSNNQCQIMSKRNQMFHPHTWKMLRFKFITSFPPNNIYAVCHCP